MTAEQIANEITGHDLYTVIECAEAHQDDEARTEVLTALGLLGVAESNSAATPDEVEAARDRVRNAITALDMP